ncbi:MAG: TetR/AcrR family transcriptional regulator [Halioglobus sp.]|nr:TetR/AcrR family transcriptional regulator [Halioglobus sp.]
MAGERRREILQIAIEIIADEGYSSLSMRSLARASGMKLGALQYHFRTWEDLLRALVGLIEEQIKNEWTYRKLDGGPTVYDIAVFMLEETSAPGDTFLNDRLWPQLWAMEQVEPLVSDLLEEVYAEYMKILVNAMEAAGFDSPHGEALCLMSLLEGESLFTGEGRRWEKDRDLVRDTILKFVENRYGKSS